MVGSHHCITSFAAHATQLYLRELGLVIRWFCGVRLGNDNASIIFKPTALLTPRNPILRHPIDGAYRGGLNWVFARKGFQCPEPVIRFSTQFFQNEANYARPQTDDALVRAKQCHLPDV